MRSPLVVGNWKMNGTPSEAATFASSLRDAKLPQGVEVGICPSYVHLSLLQHMFDDMDVFVGAQDVFWAEKGAFTGRVSAGMLHGLGIARCLVGHSETRGKFGKLETPESTVPFFAETDETVNLKVKALLAHEILPIVCVGETLAEREAGETDAVIRRQLAGGLAGVDPARVVVAYEPVWAIGTGKTCDTAEANRVCGLIRSLTRPETRVLYGGSVNEGNAAELFAQPDIDGGLVGGASLKAESFLAIVRAAGE